MHNTGCPVLQAPWFKAEQNFTGPGPDKTCIEGPVHILAEPFFFIEAGPSNWAFETQGKENVK